jgi:feruloyl esterase
MDGNYRDRRRRPSAHQANRRFGPERADDFIRLFMAPGVEHCRGGPGPDTFDAVAALDARIERGVAPNSLIASRLINGKVERTRPLCAYPQVAVYKAAGSTDDAMNFECRAPTSPSLR